MSSSTRSARDWEVSAAVDWPGRAAPIRSVISPRTGFSSREAESSERGARRNSSGILVTSRADRGRGAAELFVDFGGFRGETGGSVAENFVGFSDGFGDTMGRFVEDEGAVFD